MTRIFPVLTIIGAAGFFASLTLYILTFWNVDASATPVYMPLTIVLFATWLAAILKLVRNPELKAHQKSKSKNPVTFFKLAFKGTPVWVQVVAGASFIFAMVSFAYFIYTQPGVVGVIDGNKVLHNRGEIIKELTDQEYIKALAIDSRKSLGHFLAFFGVGTAILFPEKNTADSNKSVR